MNIFDALRADHEKQRYLLDCLIDTQGDSSIRQTLFRKIKSELSLHAIAEERFFYIPLIQHDMTQEKSRHAIAEHHELDEIIEKLDQVDYSSSAWLIEAKNLHHRLNHHLDDEEHQIFQLAGKVLTEKQKVTLGEDYMEEMLMTD
jgi:hypothetical protein